MKSHNSGGLKTRLRIVMFLIILIASVLSIASAPVRPTVNKTAYPSYKLTHQWDIDKNAGATSLKLALGQTYQLNYDVVLTHDSAASDWRVHGSGWIYNTLADPITLNEVSDIITPDMLDVDLNCHWGGSAYEIDTSGFEIPANWALVCDYNTALADGATRTNTMVANVTALGELATDIVGTATIDFSTADIDHVDECIDVEDSYEGPLGTVCWTDQTFNYAREIRYDVCGEYSLVNTATFSTNDTGAVGSASWTVNVWIPCEGGCTLTPGYWKTHSIYGPAPYDDTWTQIGENSGFFLSGQSYYEVLWTQPKKGNAYYILAHVFIAAELNALNDADMSGAVASAFGEAEGLFEFYSPDDIKMEKKNSELRSQFIALASLLDDFNNGLVGLGHCSE